MKKYVSFGIMLASLFSGCARLPSKSYIIEVDSRKAYAEVSFSQDGISSYSVYFGHKRPHSVITIKSGHMDENKNKIPDPGWMLIGCSETDKHDNTIDYAVPYEKMLTFTKGWQWDTRYSGPECALTPVDLSTASKAEEAVRKAVEKNQ